MQKKLVKLSCKYFFIVIIVTCKWIWLKLKPDLVQLILNTEANLGSQIAKLTTDVKDLLAHSTKLEADVAIVKNVNSKLVERVVVKKMLNTREGTCWRLEYHRLLGTMSLSKRFVTSFRKLVRIYVIVTFRLSLSEG